MRACYRRACKACTRVRVVNLEARCRYRHVNDSIARHCCCLSRRFTATDLNDISVFRQTSENSASR